MNHCLVIICYLNCKVYEDRNHICVPRAKNCAWPTGVGIYGVNEDMNKWESYLWSWSEGLEQDSRHRICLHCPPNAVARREVLLLRCP